MNPKSKKFISLFLVFSIMMLSVNLYAKERRGAKIKIYKTKPIMDGTPWEIPPDISGELITVKQNSLLLLDAEGKDVSVDIAEIKVITVSKKSKALLGAGLGALIGGGAGVIAGGSAYEGMSLDPSGARGILGVFGAVVGALLGAIVGAGAGKDKTFQIEGMTDSEIQETLDYLRKKARVRDYK